MKHTQPQPKTDNLSHFVFHVPTTSPLHPSFEAASNFPHFAPAFCASLCIPSFLLVFTRWQNTSLSLGELLISKTAGRQWREGCMMYPFYADKWWHWRSTSLMWAVLCTQGFQVLDLEQCFVVKVLLYQLLAEGYTRPLPSIDPSLHAHNRAGFVL